MPAASARPERPYVVAIDTREQLPYEWKGVTCQQATLSAGDYSIIGMEQVVCVERKSFADFYGCLTTGRERFENDLQRMSECRYPLVVIEASMEEFFRPYIYVAHGGIPTKSQFPLIATQNSLLSMQSRYRIPFLLCGGPSDALVRNWQMDLINRSEYEKALLEQGRMRASRMTLQHLDLVWRLEKEDAAQVKRDERISQGGREHAGEEAVRG